MLALVILPLCGTVLSAKTADRITNLPGLGEPKVPQYSGYLQVDDPQGLMDYHYWLATSESEHPEKDPVVLWMNGGPGASSLAYGSFSELGPYYLDDESMKNITHPGVPDVHENPYSWSKITNMLFVEAPPSVGYSFCHNKDCRWNDTTQAVANYAMLSKFFEEFPEYKKNDFYITGESYGGMYVPTLVEQIHHHGNQVNLKGFAVGNGIIGHQDSFPGAGGIHYEFLHNKAFISDKLWADIQEKCGASFKLPGKPTYPADCQLLLTKASKDAGEFYVYDVYDTCNDDQLSLESQMELYGQEHGLGGGRAGTPPSEAAAAADDATRTTASEANPAVVSDADLTAAAAGAGVGSAAAAYGGLGIEDPFVPCGKNRVGALWLNLPEVREAIHVHPLEFYKNTTFPGPYQPAAPFKFWHEGANNTGWNYNESRPHLLDVYPTFIEHYRTLIFNGDFDACVPYIFNDGWTKWLAGKEGWKMTREWEPWLLDGQTAGYVTTYSHPNLKNNFTFATVKGAGHMVPQYKPRQGFAMFKSFIEGSAPLYHAETADALQ